MPAIDDTVDVVWHDGFLRHRDSGRLGVALDAAGKPAELVIETDGGATFIPADAVMSVELAPAE